MYNNVDKKICVQPMTFDKDCADLIKIRIVE